jgi:hypothetical protein
MGPGQPGSQPPANPPTAIIAGVLALLTVVAAVARRFTRLGFHFNFHSYRALDLPGHIIVIGVLGAGGVMLLLRKRPGQILAIIGAVLAIVVTFAFEPGFITIGVWVLAIATIVLSALPTTARALTGQAAPPPFVPMGPPGQFGPPQSQPMPGQPMPGQLMPGQPMPGQPMAGQPMPGQPMPPQQFPQQPGFPPQQQPMPPQQPQPGYPQQQFPPPPPGQ